MLNLCSLWWFLLETLSEVSRSMYTIHSSQQSWVKKMDHMIPRDPFQPFFPLFCQPINMNKLWTIFTVLSTLHMTNGDGLDESVSSVLESPEMLFFLYPSLHIINVIQKSVSRMLPFKHSFVSHSSTSSSLSLHMKCLQVLLCGVGSFTHRRCILAA